MIEKARHPWQESLVASPATMSCQALDDRLCTALQLDGWQSGRLRTLGKRVFLNRNPGFESLPIRKPDSQLLA
jgi:hypothetical protein